MSGCVLVWAGFWVRVNYVGFLSSKGFCVSRLGWVKVKSFKVF